MKIPKLAFVFLLVGCLVVYLTYVKRRFENRNLSKPVLDQLYRTDLHKRPTSAEVVSEMFRYGIMFDAGSTGTRIHIFQFQTEPNGTTNWLVWLPVWVSSRYMLCACAVFGYVLFYFFPPRNVKLVAWFKSSEYWISQVNCKRERIRETAHVFSSFFRSDLYLV